MATRWYYTIKDRGEFGPIASEELQALLRAGNIQAADLLRREGETQAISAAIFF